MIDPMTSYPLTAGYLVMLLVVVLPLSIVALIAKPKIYSTKLTEENKAEMKDPALGTFPNQGGDDEDRRQKEIFQQFIESIAANRPKGDNALLIALLGIGTEAGELQDAFKKPIKYSENLKVEDVVNNLDLTNVAEEIGGLVNYCHQLALTVGLDLSVCMEVNNAQMKVRYGGVFNARKGLERNKTAEREAMDKVVETHLDKKSKVAKSEPRIGKKSS